MDLYREQILDHYKNPRNLGKIKGKSKSTHGENPSCGDSITMDILIKNGRIADIKFSGEGCAISIASASMLTEKVKGEKITKVADISFEDIEKMLGIKVAPSRKRCALLSLNVLKKLILKELKK
jgi:nitrogen fixation NifU-like protein